MSLARETESNSGPRNAYARTGIPMLAYVAAHSDYQASAGWQKNDSCRSSALIASTMSPALDLDTAP